MAVYRDLNPKDVTNDVVDIFSIKQSVKNIVLTDVGTVPGFPEFGSRITGLLFENMNAFTINIVQDSIQSALKKWEPRIYNVSVIVNSDPAFNQITCNIMYYIKQIDIQDSVTFKIG